MRPKKPARHTRELLTGRPIMQFSSICSSVTLQRNQLIFCGENAGQRHHQTFQVSTKSHQIFRNMNLQKLAEFLHFFILSIFVVFLFLFIKQQKLS